MSFSKSSTKECASYSILHKGVADINSCSGIILFVPGNKFYSGSWLWASSNWKYSEKGHLEIVKENNTSLSYPPNCKICHLPNMYLDSNILLV